MLGRPMTPVSFLCAGALIAYLVCGLVGPQRGLVLLLTVGAAGAAGVFFLLKWPPPTIVFGSVGGLAGGLLSRWSGTLRWPAGSKAPAKVESETPKAKAPASEPKPEPEPEPEPEEVEAPAPEAKAAPTKTKTKSKAKKPAVDEPVEEPEEEPVEGPKKKEPVQALEDALTEELADFSSLSPKPKPKPAPRPSSALKPAHSSSIPRGVFAMDEETPIALTAPKAPAPPKDLGSLFAAQTEDIGDMVAPTHCPRCSHPCDPDARYCAECSAPVVKWECKECGRINDAKADFCVRCQAPVELLASPVDVEILDE